MCTEYITTTIYRGGGCTRACNKIDSTVDTCPERPPLLSECPNYQRIDSGSTTKRGSRPGHDHGKDGDQKKGGSGGGGSLGGATEGGSAIVV